MLKIKRPIEDYAASFFLAVLVILLTVQILLRFAFGKTLSWSEEVSRFAFVWAVTLVLLLLQEKISIFGSRPALQSTDDSFHIGRCNMVCV